MSSGGSEDTDETVVEKAAVSDFAKIEGLLGELNSAFQHQSSINAVSSEDRRIFVYQKNLFRSLIDFSHKCVIFDSIVEGTHGDALILQHTFTVSIQPCLDEIKSLLDSIENEILFEATCEVYQFIRHSCNQSYARVLSLIDQSRYPKTPHESETRSPTVPRSSEMNELKLHTALLPSVPVFNGDISKFAEFIQAFNHAVHERKISSIQKLSALRSKLSGTPSVIIEHFGASAEDYDMAYKTLKEYYTGKNRTASYLINSIFDLKSVERVDLGTLENFYSKSTNLTNAIKNLKLPDLGDYFFYSILFSQLPQTLRDKFIEDQPNFAEDIPTSDQLLTFLSDQLTVLRAQPMTKTSSANRASSPGPSKFLPPRNRSPLPRSHPVANQPTQNAGCFYCHENHLVYHCRQFKKCDWITKSNFVDKNNLCRVCLSPKHKTSECPSSRTCSVCTERHHHLLHPGTPDARGSGSFSPQQEVTSPSSQSTKFVPRIANHVTSGPTDKSNGSTVLANPSMSAGAADFNPYSTGSPNKNYYQSFAANVHNLPFSTNFRSD